MLPKYLFLALALLATAATAFFAAYNIQTVPITLPGIHVDVSLALIAVKFYALGAVSAFSLWKIRSKKLKGQATQLQWQAQDAKLQAEIRSDREKQLEAKIATLETALGAALKKKG